MIKKIEPIYFIFILFSISACTNIEARIKSIETELAIEIPENIEIIQDDDISYNGFESDYTQIVTLQYKDEDFEKLINQVETSPFYSELIKYDGISTPFPNDEISAEHQSILDSLTSDARSGTWIKDGLNYKYIDFFTWSDFCQASINTTKKTLKYTHIHL